MKYARINTVKCVPCDGLRRRSHQRPCRRLAVSTPRRRLIVPPPSTLSEERVFNMLEFTGVSAGCNVRRIAGCFVLFCIGKPVELFITECHVCAMVLAGQGKSWDRDPIAMKTLCSSLAWWSADALKQITLASPLTNLQGFSK